LSVPARLRQVATAGDAIRLAKGSPRFPSGGRHAAVAAFPGANGRIAYVLTEKEEIDHQTFAPRGDIVTVLPDGSEPRELTEGPLDESGPSWSADGRSLVFSRALGEGEDQPSNYQLFLMNGDGSGQTRITDSPGNDFSPSFSPDGRRIVYSKQPSGPEGSGRSSIWTIGADGTDPRTREFAPAGLRDSASVLAERQADRVRRRAQDRSSERDLDHASRWIGSPPAYQTHGGRNTSRP
jgi:dipeptidyl aminopeptidase/acylaminoacyl peptidase